VLLTCGQRHIVTSPIKIAIQRIDIALVEYFIGARIIVLRLCAVSGLPVYATSETAITTLLPRAAPYRARHN
jgi:hypothetical protein